MPSFEQIERSFSELDRGEARMAVMRNAIREADQQQALTWQFWFRYDYLEESIFSGDRYSALIVFPELLKLYDDHPVLMEDDGCAHSLLICFKWIVEAAPEFPQISREQIDGYFREFKKRLRQQGKSLSIYYMKRLLFYLHVDMSIASMCFYRFLDEELDDISDGRALYFDQQVQYYLAVDEEEKALKAAERIFNGELRSNSLPQATYHDFIRYYMAKGNLDEAMRYAKMTEHRVNGDPYYHDIIGTLMTLYSESDLRSAAALFNRNYPDFAESKNPWLRVQFAIGAAHLFAHIGDDPERLSLIRVPHREDVRQLGAELTQIAIEYAGAFDARNGTDDYMQMYLHPFEKE